MLLFYLSEAVKLFALAAGYQFSPKRLSMPDAVFASNFHAYQYQDRFYLFSRMAGESRGFVLIVFFAHGTI
jgi:hypothetical protein